MERTISTVDLKTKLERKESIMIVETLAAEEEGLPAVPRDGLRILSAVGWRRFNWNALIGLATVVLVSAIGWAGVLLLVSSLLKTQQ
jgi:hypothetical protein